ncbi:MAG: hypothetical protein WCL19_00575 [Verrucomicrobiota bacterium]
MPSYTSSTPSERPEFVEPGDYQVEIIDAIETISKGGHDMIELKLKTSAGSYLYDFLVFIPTAFWKIDSFRAATGEDVKPDQDVEISADHVIGRTGTARLTVEEYNGKKRNKVVAWIVGTAKPSAQPQPARRSDNEPF